MRGGYRQKTASSFQEKGAEDELKTVASRLEENQSLLITLQSKKEDNEKNIWP